MRNLTVFQRLALIVAVLSMAMITLSAAQIMVLRGTIVGERQAKVREMVDVAKTVLATYDAKPRPGRSRRRRLGGSPSMR
jgi:methyl-accepting chemotaxis protein